MRQPGEKYRPGSGSEGMWFESQFCDHCLHDNGDTKCCDIIMMAMGFDITDKEYPQEWVYDEQGKPTCTKYQKWDWGKDNDGNRIEPPPPPIDDPNQLCFSFIMDEIGVPKSEELKSEVA